MSERGSYRAFIERVTSSLEYKVEVAGLELLEELTRAMGQQDISRAELARRLGSTPAYVTKALRGDVNFTLTTMVKLAEALECELHLHLARRGSGVRWLDIAPASPDETRWPLELSAGAYEVREARGGRLDQEQLAA